MNKIPHIPVLFNEVLDSFEGIKKGTLVDCTLGYGGHTEGLLKRYININLIGIDRDNEALEFSKKRLEKFKNRVEFRQGSYSKVFLDLKKDNIVGVLADIGVSSLQLDKLERGFSFKSEILDMRMNQDIDFSAYDVVNRYSLSDLEYIIKEYGEERAYKKIAKLIVQERKKEPIKTASKLAELISRHHRAFGIHPATKTFQAIRIEVNDELGELKRLLENIRKSADDGTIISIITFHSLEDRIVKQTFREWAKSCVCPSDIMRCECGNNNQFGKIINKKPIVASKDEIKQNPRSRSAKLRSFRVGNERQR